MERFGVKLASVTLSGAFRRIDTFDDVIFDDKLFLVYSASTSETPTTSTQSYDTLIVNRQPEHSLKYSHAFFDILAFGLDRKVSYTEHRYRLTTSDFS
jgi:hypothetical protein